MWNISPAFRAAIQSPVHTMTVKAQVLDTDFNVVEGGEFYDTANERHIQNYIVDGQVDLDVTRGNRRTMNLTVINPDAEFTPNSEWGGLFYVNRLIRIWRGVVLEDGSEEFAPVGTFMIDTADVVAERNMSIVPITGSDLWKMVAKTKFGNPVRFNSGTPITTVIQTMAEFCGVTNFVVDDLSHRTAQTREIQAALNFEMGAVAGDEILKLATAWGLDVYFDQLGRMVIEELRLSRASVWDYKPGEDTSLLTVKASYKDEQLYNHIVVTGTADPENPVYAIVYDEDPSSPTYYLRIGKRTLQYESTMIATYAQALDTANKLLARNTRVTEDIELQAICNPALEGNDAITVVEQQFSKLNHRLRIQSLTVPLSSSRQTIRLRRMIVV